MSNVVVFHPKAAEEYIESYNWYKNQQNGLEYRFEVAIDKILERIKLHPEWYGYGRKPYRETVVEGFPFVIIYKQNKEQKEIYVVAIYHTKKSHKRKYRK